MGYKIMDCGLDESRFKEFYLELTDSIIEISRLKRLTGTYIHIKDCEDCSNLLLDCLNDSGSRSKTKILIQNAKLLEKLIIN